MYITLILTEMKLEIPDFQRIGASMPGQSARKICNRINELVGDG